MDLMRSFVGRRRSRSGVALVCAMLGLLVSGQAVLASVSWSSAHSTSPAYSYNIGSGLARTTTPTTSYLHVQYTETDVAHPGVYYRRGNAAGTTWGTPKRLNPSGGYAEHGAIAAAGRYVYVVHQALTHWDNRDLLSVRVKVNTKHGASSAWLTAKTLSGVNTHTGTPAVAATGRYVWVAYTNADTGGITLANNTGINAEEGGWVARDDVGTTTRGGTDADGYDGQPVIAATGSTIMLAWIDSDAGGLKVKVSTDNGQSWPDEATTITSEQVWGVSATASSGRVALAWVQSASAVMAKVWKAGAWGSTRTVASFTPTGKYRNGYGTAVALAGTGRVGVAWSACTRSNCSAGSTKGVNVRWRESTDNLATWKKAVTVASYKSKASRRINDFPSVVMTAAPKRYITYNIANASGSKFRLVTEVGAGKP
jgi:hypothetical protein